MRLRILRDLLRPHLPTLVLGTVLGLVANAAALATPMVTKWVLDSLQSDGGLAGPVTWLLVLVVAGAAVGLWQWILFGRLGERVVLEARRLLVGRVLRARVGEVVATPSGEVVTRVTSDTGLLHGASSSLVGLVNAVVSLIGTLVLMAVLDLPLLAVTVAAVVVITVVMLVLMPRIASAQTQAQASVGQIGATLEGAVRAIRTVKASRAEDRLGGRIDAHAETAAAHGVRAAVTSAVVWTISWTGIQLAIIVILGFGAWRTSEGAMAVSTLVAFLLYAFGLMGPISELTQHLTALQSGVAAAQRIEEMSRFTPESASTPGDRPPLPRRDDDPVLELVGVSARYSADFPEVLRDLTLSIPRRGHTAVVGPSGAGKTTLLSLLLRFLEPTGGEVRLDGRPYADWSPQQVRERLGYVEQETPLVPGTVRDNVVFSHPDADELEVRHALAAVRLDHVVDELPEGADTDLQAGQLSGGQRQRIAVARAILRTPEVLLLDEATAQVDGLTEQALAECIRAVSAQAAVVTVAHRLSTVIDADQIVVLDAGRVRAVGTHAELLVRDELYAELVAALRIHEERPVLVD